ncbi:MAG: GDSL-type esterase/lipase family protein [Candidatus Omnitrophica bacterium]|nr:GDSL-type esterase/lipase family protein [Candidatus Omnitrophota bacterium]
MAKKHRLLGGAVIGLILVCLLLISVLPEYFRQDYANINSRGKNIICFGDSITFGFGAPAGQSYPDFLSQKIDIPVLNAGVEGDTSTQAMFRIYSDVLSRDPLLVIIEFGGNDFLRSVPPENTVANIENMVKAVNGAGAMVALVELSTRNIMKRHSQEIRQLARKHNCILISAILDKIIADPSLKSDFVHPNAQGYKAIAERVYRGIRPVLNRNIILREQPGLTK